MQTNLDLRARFANVMEEAKREEAPKAVVRRPYVTKGRIELIRDMLFERFDAVEAQRRFEHFDWERMGKVKFEEIYNWLRQMPKRVSVEQAPAARQQTSSITVTVPLIEGYFTVVMSEDEDDYRTFEIVRQDEDAKFMPGRLVLGYLSGQSNYTDYTSFGHVTEDGRVVVWSKHRGNADLAEALKVLVGDPKAAASAYFRASKNCAKCGQRITRADSLSNAEENGGLGPKCAGDAKAAGW